MKILENVEPKKVMSFFEEISSIPHGSKNEMQISNYLVNFAKERNLEVIQDEAYNVIIIKEATEGYENAEPIILQGHMDMVCEKVKESDHNFETDPLKLKVEGNILTAEGTTLGADDGIAVAMELAVLDSNDLQHPRVECIFTTDEETGLYGAEAIDVSMLKGKKLINIDSEEEGVFTVSCAGGAPTISKIPLHFEEMEGQTFELKVCGLQGGHSGAEINKERLNANIIMGRILYTLSKEVEFNLIDINGGNADNVITKECIANIIVANHAEKVEPTIHNIQKIMAHECKVTDPNITITSQDNGANTVKAMDAQTTKNVYSLLLAYPQGIYAMSMEIEGLVESSLNLGVLRTEENTLLLTAGVRSSVESRIHFLVDRITSIVAVFNGQTTCQGSYPGWEYKADSPLKDMMVEIYKKQYGKEPVIEAIHAGLECGMFSQKIENLDCISIGPNLANVHTPDEIAEIDSIQRVWKFLVEVLKESK